MQEKYFPHKYNKKCHFFYKKMWRAGLLKLKFFMKIKEASRKKTSQNNFFDSPALHCENAIWNIQIFASISLLFHNILQGKFEAKLKKSDSDIFLLILSEIIILLENGSCGGNLSQISNRHQYVHGDSRIVCTACSIDKLWFCCLIYWQFQKMGIFK